MVDCLIVGSGIAGISAALTLQANGRSFEIFGSSSLSTKIEKAEMIHNYPGLADVSGKQFVARLKEQLSAAEIAVREETVGGVYAMKDKFIVQAGQNSYEGKTVVLAAGVENVRPIKGEEEFLGRGVSYCATCDGFLYKGKTLAIVCTSARFEHEIEFLAGLAEKAYVFPLYKGAKIEGKNVELLKRLPSEIVGEKRVRAIVVGEEEKEVDGVFLLKESVSPAALVGGLEVSGGHVVVDRHCKTNLKGLFAAGDCTGRPYQYAKAAGEGNVAAFSVLEFLAGR
ncbi:MAG: NAD(P)/FAD-dependent oxidoreductase [Clostridia bacterium]|nr:NAD(P)/FAD-dependent oxidoreductase [Clostridia bacterium]